jgi:branched-chain amino acid transport system ATP-binding protein
MLNVSNLSSNYANIRAVRNISLRVEAGQLVGLIGANGSGKSTTLKTIAGYHKATTGSVVFDGTDITNRSPYKNVRSGLSFVPERPESVLQPMTVGENLGLSSFAGRGNHGATLEKTMSLFPMLAKRQKQIAGSLSGGEQQMLALARAMLTDPKLLLVDSPAIGLAPAIVDRVYDAVLGIREAGVSVLLIEQNAAMALVICDFMYVVHRGQVVMEGPSATLRDSQEVIDAYLG